MWLFLLLVLGLPLAHVIYVHVTLGRLRSEVARLRDDLSDVSSAARHAASRVSVAPPGPAVVASTLEVPRPAPTLDPAPAATTWSRPPAQPIDRSGEPPHVQQAPVDPVPGDQAHAERVHVDALPPAGRPHPVHSAPLPAVAAALEIPRSGPTLWWRQPAAETMPAQADDVEITVGTTWTLRVGLAAIAIAVALFARTVVPDLSPLAKVALAYAGAWLLFGAGKYVEGRVERFARPVMASGLALAFFVSFAAYFVPAMRAVPLAASLLWMAAGVGTVLFFATRWRSQPTAALAIFLGHVAAYVAAGDASGASLVAIAFLSLTAVVLLLRNDWLPLSLFAVLAANGTHLLWALAAQGTMPKPTFMALNLLFLSSYYVIFMIADVVWWRRRGAQTATSDGADAGRVFGPTNLVVFVTVAWWMLAQGTATSTMTVIFFFVLAAVQAALAVALRRLGSPDDAIYIVAATALLTLGLFAAFDALALDLLLVALALVLLLVAHRARRRVFHFLAQGALAVSFLHAWFGGSPLAVGSAYLVGGVAIAIAYLVMAQLQTAWYGRDPLPWGEPTPAFRPLQEEWDVFFRSVAPWLPAFHAVAGALLVLRTIDVNVAPDAAAAAASLALVALAALAISSSSLPSSLAWLVTQAGVLAFANGAAPSASPGFIIAAIGVSVPLLMFRRSARADAPFGRAGRWIAQVGLWLAAAAVVPLVAASPAGAASTATYLAWIALAGLVFAFAASARNRSFAEDGAAGTALMHDAAAPLTAGAGALLVLFVTHHLLGAVVAAPVFASAWAVLLAVAAWRLRDRTLDFAAILLVAATVPVFHLSLGLGPAVANAPWASAAVIIVPLLLALVWDQRLRAAAADAGLRLVPYALYGLGAVIWVYVVYERTALPWSEAWAMLLPIALLVAALRGTLPRAPWVALTLTLSLALLRFADVMVSGGTGAAWATVITALAIVAVERLSRRHLAAVDGGAKWLSLCLVGTTGALAFAAVALLDTSGATWTTVAWSLVAAMILALGFLWRAAAYRRVGLVAFGLTLIRVFVVDVQNLPTGTQTVAFLALGVSLVAVAWLYARYAGEVRRWL
jgi:hypothetical protein